MKLLARIATHHACDLVEELYRASRNVTYTVSTSSCGVYVAHWFDHYLSSHVLSSEDAVTTETEPLSGTELEKIRYKLFCYVFFGMATRSGK
ncbi:hypothetical protein JG687_00014338 [Phytophthora cactorum]|uniref:Uncharacterized protein n=1 Tax=Phytophthora cactorum TaxID=29920 RepID=A0A8T1TZ09_9STRA|nr:hypothetical protein GQ600_10309 [Phytophthora cactorum]KAG6950300.1 hypothetical protein JG687_00014338 [Phytophthora cactorum]